ncbi:MarP family serine protease [Thermocrispum municipale]|uniref:MarP family serine protease n=1 Tax=Thermocrispum municipale TaxID=37926 RepID=UPI0004178261|nr:MarP family serine protease [Thermocrispum municipale]
MNWVDVLVVVVAVIAAASGARQGVIIALPAFLGVLAGAVIGIKVAPLIVDMFDHPAAKVAFAVATVVFLVALGETFGVWIGRTIKERVDSPKLAWLDNSLGAIVQGIVVFVVAWLIALPLTSVSGLPGLASAINGSAVLSQVNDVMPEQARALPNDLRKLLDVSGLPSVIAPFVQPPAAEVQPPDKRLQRSPVVRELRDKVLKIRGDAPSCSRTLEGSGFVVAPQRVMTNAHVVAGTTSVRVETDEGTLPARVTHFDPDVDVAVLAVPDLNAAPIPFADVPAASGDNAIVLGYPLDGPYTATAARIRQRTELRGPDIYESKTVRRDVFTVRGSIRSGNSGGPMVNPDGEVIGLVFGASVQDPDTGFTLTAAEVEPEARRAPEMVNDVGTGRCTA